MSRRLADPPYLAFPLRIGNAPRLIDRSGHIRGQIEQVLFTIPGERVFRPDFGAGVRALLFEPNHSALWAVTKRRLTASLAEALRGEVDPKSIEVEVQGNEAQLIISVTYTLAAIGQREHHRFDMGEQLMAQNPDIKLVYADGCPDCGSRQVDLPRVLPELGDDFDWLLRDYDGFRLFMLEELAGRFPERKRWTPADVEVVLAEVLAAVLDQLSDNLDRASSEAYLETARRPESVRRLLQMIGYDVTGLLASQGLPPFNQPPHPDDERTTQQRLDQFWLDHPEKMQQARQSGPRAIHSQHRMVTLEDTVTRLEEHPLVLRAQASESWGGSWSVIKVAIISWARQQLDGHLLQPLEIAHSETDIVLPDDIWQQVANFHAARGLTLPGRESRPTLRSLLRHYIDDYRMLGQQIQLVSAVEVGILLSLSVQVNINYFQSEVRHAVENALGTGPGGFFAPGRLRFGEDLWAGDLFEALMALDGVENLCLNRFKRIGDRYADASDLGRIVLSGLEVAVCDNDAGSAHRGYYLLRMNGGRSG